MGKGGTALTESHRHHGHWPWGHHPQLWGPFLPFASGVCPPTQLSKWLSVLLGSGLTCSLFQKSCPLLREHRGQFNELMLAKQLWRDKCCVSTKSPCTGGVSPCSLALLPYSTDNCPERKVLAQTKPLLQLHGLGG